MRWNLAYEQTCDQDEITQPHKGGPVFHNTRQDSLVGAVSLELC